jgi:hypothetical protein
MSWLSRWHFEGRHRRNKKPQGLAELQSGLWTEMSKAMSVYHDDGKGAAERKFVRASEESFLGLGGHEAIWNPDTNSLIEEGAYRATYNYVNPGGILRGLGHVMLDVVPYWFGGTQRGNEGTTFVQRLTGKAPRATPKPPATRRPWWLRWTLVAIVATVVLFTLAVIIDSIAGDEPDGLPPDHAMLVHEAAVPAPGPSGVRMAT